MKLDLCLFAASPDIHDRGFMVHVLTGSPTVLCERSLELGYNGFEFMPNPECVPNPGSYLDALQATGAVLPVVNTGRMVRQGLTLFHEDARTARRAVEAFKRILDFAGAVKAKAGLGIARGPARNDLSADEMDRLAADVFGELAEHAERVGTTILLESAETNVTSYILTMAEVMSWVDRIDSPAFGAMLDTHQLVESEPSIEHGIRAARGQATHIHLFDPGRRPPGTHPGGLDWQQVFSVLANDGFHGSASVSLPQEGDIWESARNVASFLLRTA